MNATAHELSRDFPMNLPAFSSHITEINGALSQGF